MPNRDGTLKVREFVFLCEDLVLKGLPSSVPAPEHRVRWTMLQLHFGDPRVHFELQLQMRRGVVEAGLHFEGDLEANDAWVELLASRAADLLGELGPVWELEEWTASWRRLHRPFPFDQLTTALAHEVAESLVQAIAALHPILEEGPATPPPAKRSASARRTAKAQRRRRARR